MYSLLPINSKSNSRAVNNKARIVIILDQMGDSTGVAGMEPRKPAA